MLINGRLERDICTSNLVQISRDICTSNVADCEDYAHDESALHLFLGVFHMIYFSVSYTSDFIRHYRSKTGPGLGKRNKRVSYRGEV